MARCEGVPVCLRCPSESLPPLFAGIFPEGIVLPLTYEVTRGAFVAGQRVPIEITAQTGLTSTTLAIVSVEAEIQPGGTLTFVAARCGTGSAVLAVPAGVFMSMDDTLELDLGSTAAEFEVDEAASSVLIMLESASVDVTVVSPVRSGADYWGWPHRRGRLRNSRARTRDSGRIDGASVYSSSQSRP